MDKVKIPMCFKNWLDVEFLYTESEFANSDSFKKASLIDKITKKYQAATSQPNKLEDWIQDNYLTAINAIVNGYEVEEKKYLAKFNLFEKYHSFLNYDHENEKFSLMDEMQTETLQTQFTLDFLNEKFPHFKEACDDGIIKLVEV